VTPDWILAAIGVAGIIYHAGLLTANLRELRRITSDHETRIRHLEAPPLQPATRL
jgi:hypothetical protein